MLRGAEEQDVEEQDVLDLSSAACTASLELRCACFCAAPSLLPPRDEEATDDARRESDDAAPVSPSAASVLPSGSSILRMSLTARLGLRTRS